MKIKHQLLLSFGFLFAVILLLGGVGSYYIYRLARDSRAIIQDNNRSLDFMQEIDEALDDIQFLLASPSAAGYEEPLSVIRKNLNLQQANITERGEERLTLRLKTLTDRLDEALAANPPDALAIHSEIHEINTLVNTIFNLNQDAIEQRNQTAGKTADEVFLYMIIFGAGSIIIGLMVTLGMPSVISKPVDTLNDAISQVARGRYDINIPIITENEFGRLARSFNKMAQKLKEYEESNLARILFEKKRLDAVIDQFNGAVIGLDEAKMIIFVNERALSLIGQERGKLIGRYAPDIALVNPLMQKLTSRLIIGFDYWEKEAYGPIKITENKQEKLFSQEVIHVSIKPTGEDRRVLIGHVIILTDITEFAEKDRAKTRFIATLSHELKTPVAAIDMAASLLENQKTGGLNGGQRECLSTIRENNKRIQRIINEILDLSKIESGSIEVINEKTSVEQLINKAVLGVIPFAEDKHIDIRADLPDRTLSVIADPQKTIWVLNNFLTNAIRYSPSNDIIEMSARENEVDVALSVKDNGKGIAPGLKDKLFQPYARSKDDDAEGAGLGLAISKEFIEAMGGSIGVQSEPGQGATFWIKLRKARD